MKTHKTRNLEKVTLPTLSNMIMKNLNHQNLIFLLLWVFTDYSVAIVYPQINQFIKSNGLIANR